MSEKNWKGLQETNGVVFRNRMHLRTVSIEVFRQNADQIIVFLKSNIEPMEVWKAQGDLEVSHQTMRESARRLHNFLAGAMTLVDHTRVMMNEHYAGTSIRRRFDEMIAAYFKGNTLTRFVQDLRNYMIHVGVPPITRALTAIPVPNGAPAQVNVSVRWVLSKSALMRFKNWNSDAKAFLAAASDEINILQLVEDYRDNILPFHAELDGELEIFHAKDLKEAIEYEEELRARTPNG